MCFDDGISEHSGEHFLINIKAISWYKFFSDARFLADCIYNYIFDAIIQYLHHVFIWFR
jgi:hypothetical protein